RLATAGAFHTRYMASALDAYAEVADKITPSEPTVTLLSNADGAPVTSAADAMTKLVAQLTRPVRWDLCTATMRDREVSAVVEFPPAGTLTGIAKRELKGTPTHPVKSPADLDALAESLRA
ncbi:MAG: ACP S-malonyltransferase, partial [Mycobacterium sp.]